MGGAKTEALVTEPECEPVTENIQAEIRRFASQDFAERERILPDLLKLINAYGKREELGNLSLELEFSAQLQEAINKALATPWDIGKENPIKPWTGGYTVVALEDDGTIVGLAQAPTTGYEIYGDLTPYALAKAVCALHLNKAVGEGHNTFAGGLSTLSNIRYLRRLGNATHDGATENPVDVNHRFVFLGGSGCTATAEYLRTLLDEGGEPGLYTFAGEFDRIFVDLVKRFLARPESGTDPVSEPLFGQEIKAVKN